MKHQDATWGQIGVLWCFVVILFAILFWPIGILRTSRENGSAKHAKSSERLEEMKRKLSHPMAKAAFESGYEFGARHKQSGLTKMSETELDEFALNLCDKIKAPADIRGTVVKKFKDGYGWGFWNTP